MDSVTYLGTVCEGSSHYIAYILYSNMKHRTGTDTAKIEVREKGTKVKDVVC